MNFMTKLKENLKEKGVKLTAVYAAIAVLGTGMGSVSMSASASSKEENDTRVESITDNSYTDDLKVNVEDTTYTYDEVKTVDANTVDNIVYEASKKQDKVEIKVADKKIKQNNSVVNIGAYDGVSIVDALASVGYDYSFASCENLAKECGITDYRGTAEQNTIILNRLKKQAKTIEKEAKEVKKETPKKEHKHSFKLVKKVIERGTIIKHTIVKKYKCSDCDKTKTVKKSESHKFSKFKAFGNLLEKAVCKKCKLIKFRLHDYKLVEDKDGEKTYKCVHKGCKHTMVVPKKDETKEPNKPVEPVNPITPEEPVKPVDPVVPVEPNKPVQPITPVVPVNPWNPSTPSNPNYGGETDINKPSDTNKPGDTQKPDDSQKPGDTNKPGESEKPTNPEHVCIFTDYVSVDDEYEEATCSCGKKDRRKHKYDNGEYGVCVNCGHIKHNWVIDGEEYYVAIDDETHQKMQNYIDTVTKDIEERKVGEAETHNFGEMIVTEEEGKHTCEDCQKEVTHKHVDHMSENYVPDWSNDTEKHPCLVEGCNGMVIKPHTVHVMDKIDYRTSEKYCNAPYKVCGCGHAELEEDLIKNNPEKYEHTWGKKKTVIRNGKIYVKETCTKNNCGYTREYEKTSVVVPTGSAITTNYYAGMTSSGIALAYPTNREQLASAYVNYMESLGNNRLYNMMMDEPKKYVKRK